MDAVRVTGKVDENHQLWAQVPATVTPGPVTVLIVPVSQEDEAGDMWTMGIAQQWADELGDPAQDIYTMADGEPVREA